jgi:hypothetical protein
MEAITLKFLRRPDLDARARLFMATAMLCTQTRTWGLVAELARRFNVSRQFLYLNQKRALDAFETPAPKEQSAVDPDVDKLILGIRLYCNGSVEGISQVLKDVGQAPNSVGYVSRFLRDAAKSCSLRAPVAGTPLVLMLDEIFSDNRPIFVVMDAKSHCILYIGLMLDRNASTWVKVLEDLERHGVDFKKLVKDQGASLKAASLFLELLERADLYHLHKPFDAPLANLERHAYGAIAHLEERLRIFANRKTEQAAQKVFEQCEKAEAQMQQAIRGYDDYNYLHLCLHEAFDPFDARGLPRTRETAQGDVEAALALMEEAFPSYRNVQDAVRFMRGNVGDFWSYFDELAQIVRRHAKNIPEHTMRAACLGWMLGKKAMAVKPPSLKSQLKAQADAQMQLALAGTGRRYEKAIGELCADLEGNVRSSSPLEAINSVIRSYLNACRGQTAEQALVMLAYFMNHRKATRGKYAGTSAWERATGIPETESPIDLILRAKRENAPPKPAKPLPMRPRADGTSAA